MQTWSHFSIMGIVQSCKVNLNVCLGLMFVFIYFRYLVIFLFSLFFLDLLFENKSCGVEYLGLRCWHTRCSSWRDHFCFRTKLSGTGSLLQHSILHCVHFGLKGRFLSKMDLIHYFTWLT